MKNKVIGTGFIISVLLLILCLFYGKTQLNKNERKIIEYETEIKYLKNQNSSLENMIIAKNVVIRKVNDSLNFLKKYSLKLQSDYKKLLLSYEKIRNEINNLPVNESYDFLVHKAYPLQGEGKFIFNEPQIKEIHINYIEKIELEKINENISEQLRACIKQVNLKDTIINQSNLIISYLTIERDNFKNITNKQDTIIQVQRKEITKQRTAKTFWKTMTMIFAGVSVGVLTIF